MSAPPDLAGHLLRSLLLCVEAQGHDAVGLMRQVRSTSLVGPRARATWEDFTSLLEAFSAQHGLCATEALMKELATRHSGVRAASELLGAPRLTYLVMLEALMGRQALVALSWELAAQGLRVRVELSRGLAPSQMFFQCCAWFLAGVPQARGLGEALVHVERLSDRELVCVVTPPEEAELTLPHAESNVRPLARELYRTPETPVPARAPVTAQSLQARFGFTRAEARVVQRLAEGSSIKRIAEELDVSPETARTHAKRAMQKTDTHRQAELVSLVLQGRR